MFDVWTKFLLIGLLWGNFPVFIRKSFEENQVFEQKYEMHLRSKFYFKTHFDLEIFIPS